MVAFGARPPGPLHLSPSDLLHLIAPVPPKKPPERQYAQEKKTPSNRTHGSCCYISSITSSSKGYLPLSSYFDETLIVEFVSGIQAYGAESFWIVTFPIVEPHYAQSSDLLIPTRLPRIERHFGEIKTSREKNHTSREDTETVKFIVTGTRSRLSSFSGRSLAPNCQGQKQDRCATKSKIVVCAHTAEGENEEQDDGPQHHSIPGAIGKDNIQAWKSGAGHRKEWRKGAQKRIATRRQQIRADNHQGRQKSQKVTLEQQTTTIQPLAMLDKRQRLPLHVRPNPKRDLKTSSRRRVRLTRKRQDYELLRYAEDSLCCDIPDDDLDSYVRPEPGHDNKSVYDKNPNTSTQLTVTLAPELLCPPVSVHWDCVFADPLNTKGAVALNKQSSLREVQHTELSSAQSQKKHLAHPLSFREPSEVSKEAAKYSTVLTSDAECRGPVGNQDNGRSQNATVKKKRRIRNRGIRKLAIPYFRSIQHLGDFITDKTHRLRQLEPAIRALSLERSSSQNLEDKQHNFIQTVEKKWNQLTALQRTYRLAQQDVRRVNSVLEELMLEERVYREIIEETNLDLEESLWMMRKNPIVTSRRNERTGAPPIMDCWSQNYIECNFDLWDWLFMQDTRVQARINSEGGVRHRGSAGAERSYDAMIQNFPGCLKLLFDY